MRSDRRRRLLHTRMNEVENKSDQNESSQNTPDKRKGNVNFECIISETNQISCL